MKRIGSKIVTLLTMATLILNPSIGVSAAEISEPVASVSETEEIATVNDVWASGRISYNSGGTSKTEYLNAGTIAVSISSTRAGAASGTYYQMRLEDVRGHKYSSWANIPRNGMVTVSFPNMPAGNYQVSFRLVGATRDDIQYYTIYSVRNV